MRSAAHRRQDEAIPEPPPRDLAADTAALLDRAGTLMTRLEAGEAGTRLIGEMVVMSVQFGDLTAALEDAAAGESVVEAVGRAEYARGWNDRDAAGQQSSRPRHAARRGYLRGLPSIPATATRTAAAAVVAAGLTGGAVAGIHDASAVRAIAASPFRHAALHSMAPDQAVVIPRFSPGPSGSPSPRPSAAAASARPVPVVTAAVPSSSPPAPAPSASPPPPVPPAPSPSLLVSVRDLALSGTAGTFTITAQDGTVDWSVSTDIPGASAVAQAGGRQGVLSPAQEPVTITVTAPPGESGFVYVKWDGGGIASVWVTSGLGVPALALP